MGGPCRLQFQLNIKHFGYSHFCWLAFSHDRSSSVRILEDFQVVMGNNLQFIDKGEAGEGSFAEYVLELADTTAERLELDADFHLSDIVVREEFLGNGYGVVGDLERRAIRLTAETEGVLLDPVYTGRAMGGLITMIEQGEFSSKDRVLFWHTGGLPALFSYAEELQK